MKKENTTQKGDSFENKVFNIIHELLDNNDLFMNGKKSQIFRKKGYYSEVRKDKIIVDVSIETYLNNATQYSLLTIIECKSYGHKGVPVDDIEEFDSKLNQIGEHITRGIIVTDSHFQKGAINIAKFKKIGLIRINERDEVDWVNYRKDKRIDYSLNSIESDLISNDTKYKFCALYGKKFFIDLPNLLIEIGILDKFINKSKYINLPFKTEHEIDRAIIDFGLKKFNIKGKLSTLDICGYLKESFNISFDFDNDLGFSESKKILGKISFKPLVISITQELKDDIYRWRFTLAHEIGHFVLHFDTLKEYLDENIDNELTLGINSDDILPFYNKRLEIQANLFASRLLIPQEEFIKHVYDYFTRERINKGYLYLDWQKCNMELTMRLLCELQNHFEVSKEAAKIRLISAGLLKDTTDLSIQGVFRRD